MLLRVRESGLIAISAPRPVFLAPRWPRRTLVVGSPPLSQGDISAARSPDLGGIPVLVALSFPSSRRSSTRRLAHSPRPPRIPVCPGAERAQSGKSSIRRTKSANPAPKCVWSRLSVRKQSVSAYLFLRQLTDPRYPIHTVRTSPRHSSEQWEVSSTCTTMRKCTSSQSS